VLKWGVGLYIAAIGTGLYGFTAGDHGMATDVAKVLYFIFIGLIIVMLIFGNMLRKK